VPHIPMSFVLFSERIALAWKSAINPEPTIPKFQVFIVIKLLF
jgi:hypothetical protein